MSLRTRWLELPDQRVLLLRGGVWDEAYCEGEGQASVSYSMVMSRTG